MPTEKPVVERPQPAEEPDRTAEVEEEPMISEHFLRADGTWIVNGRGEEVILRGCNLGNWLLLEMWMLEWTHLQDQYELEQVLEERFGPETRDHLMEIYRSNWIRERDFPIIRSFGFNCIRLPFNYRLLMDEDRPCELKPNAFYWLDRAVEWARQYGLYVILDLHGTPGGQSTDHTTGRKGQNKLWEPENRKRTAWLWKQIADHYKDSPVVAAYDLINEPYGDTRTEAHQQALVETIDLIYDAVREVDQRHLLLIPGTHAGISFYGNPEDHGWENVGFTEHFYPGLFGEDTTRDVHGRFIARTIPWKARQLAELNVPYLVGEFNVVFHHVGGAALMRKYYDLYAENGWAATMWCYKLIQKSGGVGRDNWYMVKNAEPMPLIRPETASLEQLEDYFRWFGTMDYAIYENLGAALTAPTPPPVTLPAFAELPVVPGALDDPAPWQADDIGGALSGGQAVNGNTMTIYGGGEDVWNSTDQFRFVSQTAAGDFYLAATLEEFLDSHIYAKAGLMLRAGLEPDAPHFLLNLFPDGEVVLAWRSEKGGKMRQKSIGNVRPPAKMAMVRDGEYLEVGVADKETPWQRTRVHLVPALHHGGRAGFAVLSHDNRALTYATFGDIKFTHGHGPR
jgi:glucan 1,3-beta-glucosidase